MTQEDKAEYDILMGNVIIREFMNEPQIPIRCEYHRSWDWLMPVVEKIGAMDLETTGEKLAITRVLLSIGSTKNPISDLWFAVIQFIKWYNSNNSNGR